MAKKCATNGCGKTPHGNKKYCSKHQSQLYRAKYPIKACYDTLKMNAKRRGKEFTITLFEFNELILDTGYVESRGRLKDSLTIHRVVEEIGYVSGNLSVRTNADNLKAYNDFIRSRKNTEGDIVTNVEVDF